MLSEFPAHEIEFAGVGAEAASAAEAAVGLADFLRGWCTAHAAVRILQLSVMPATHSGGDRGFGAMALIAYTRTTLTELDAAVAVAAAVEEIHEAQAGGEEADQAIG